MLDILNAKWNNLYCYQVMLTVLTYLELGEVQYLRLLPQLNVTCNLNFHKVSTKQAIYMHSLDA